MSLRRHTRRRTPPPRLRGGPERGAADRADDLADHALALLNEVVETLAPRALKRRLDAFPDDRGPDGYADAAETRRRLIVHYARLLRVCSDALLDAFERPADDAPDPSSRPPPRAALEHG